MKQPLEIPRVATDATFPVDDDTDAGESTRLRPSDSLLARGFRADKRRPARHENWMLGTLADNVRTLVDIYALNYQELALTMSSAPKTGANHRAVGCTDSDGVSWYVVLGADQRAYRTQFIGAVGTQGGDYSGATEAITDFSGQQAGVLAACSNAAPSKVYFSVDAGANWTDPSGALPAATFDTLAYSNELELWFATGASSGGLATCPKFGGAQAWTGHTLPWSPVTDTNGSFGPRIIVPRAGESGNGVLFLPTNVTSDNIWYTLDGTNYNAITGLGYGGIVDACWHEAAERWYLVTADGVILSSATLAGPWTLVETLAVAGSSACSEMVSWGRNLVITGSGIGGPAGPTKGSLVVVADPAVGPFLSATLNAFRTVLIAEFDGQLVLSGAPGGSSLFLSVGMRAPWALDVPGAP